MGEVAVKRAEVAEVAGRVEVAGRAREVVGRAERVGRTEGVVGRAAAGAVWRAGAIAIGVITAGMAGGMDAGASAAVVAVVAGSMVGGIAEATVVVVMVLSADGRIGAMARTVVGTADNEAAGSLPAGDREVKPEAGIKDGGNADEGASKATGETSLLIEKAVETGTGL